MVLDNNLQVRKSTAYGYLLTGIAGCLVGHMILAIWVWLAGPLPWELGIITAAVLGKSLIIWLAVFIVGYFLLQLYFYWQKPSQVEAETRQVQALFQAKIRSALENLQEKSIEERWQGFRQFRVVRKEAECLDRSIMSFYLQPYHAETLPRFRSGQYLTVRFNHVPGQNQAVVRCYSLSDSYYEDYYRVSIKRLLPPPDKPQVAPGLSSNFFHDHIQVNDLVDVKAPSGNFYLRDERPGGVVLIAGGVGITPVLSMLNTLIANHSKRDIWFFYGLINSDQHAFKNYLEDIVSKNPHVHLQVCYSKPLPADERGVDYQHEGRVSVDLFKELLPSSNYQYYICGPGPMMASITEGLRAWGVPDRDVHFEAFGPASVPGKKKPAASSGQRAKVILRASEQSLEWSGEFDNILALAAAQGVDLKSGCRMGNCSACQVRLLEGKILYPEGKPGAEIESGHCLLCVGVPDGDVVLDA